MLRSKKLSRNIINIFIHQCYQRYFTLYIMIYVGCRIPFRVAQSLVFCVVFCGPCEFVFLVFFFLLVFATSVLWFTVFDYHLNILILLLSLPLIDEAWGTETYILVSLLQCTFRTKEQAKTNTLQRMGDKHEKYNTSKFARNCRQFMMILFVKSTKGIPVVHKFCQLMKSSPIAVDVQMRDNISPSYMHVHPPSTKRHIFISNIKIQLSVLVQYKADLSINWLKINLFST